MIRRPSVRVRRLALLVIPSVLLTACGDGAVVEPVPTNPEGIWRLTQAGGIESTLRLASDGSFDRVVADLAGGSCASSSGTWRVDGPTLRLSITTVANAPASAAEIYTFAVAAGSLRLDGSGVAGDYSPASSMVSCVDYGFGTWTGTLRADVDGVEITFALVRVRVDVEGGEAEIEGLYSSGPDELQLLLRIEGGPGPLGTGAFTVQNEPGATDTFYGLYHPEPGSVTFSGFDTTRLSPPGTFTLSAVAPERVAATFSFRANLRVEGEVGPGGATFAEIESGRVDFLYQ